MEYHKINTVFQRDEAKRLREGVWSDPVFEYLAGCQWRCTEKVDGTNIRIMWDGDAVTFGGRTDGAQIPATLVNWLVAKFLSPSTRAYLKQDFPDGGLTIYGEGYGSEIGKQGRLYLKDTVAFTVFDVQVGQWWLEPHNVLAIAGCLNLTTVPVWGFGTLFNAIEATRKGFESFYGPFRAEGLVCTPTVSLFSRKGDRIIAKIKHRDFANAIDPQLSAKILQQVHTQ